MGRFFKLTWWGFWINALSGVFLLMAGAATKMTNWVFGVKMIFIVIAMIALPRIQVRMFRQNLAKLVPRGAKAAGVSRACWVLATTAGRFMAYFGRKWDLV